MATSLAQITVKYEAVAAGTAPFENVLDFGTDDVMDATSLQDLLDGFQDSWDDQIAPILSSGTSGGSAKISAVVGGVVYEATAALGTGGDSVGANAVGGFAYRILKKAPRPPRGKPGSFYLGGIKANWSSGGVVDSSELAAINTRLSDFYDALVAIDSWDMVVKRMVDGSSSTSYVTGLSCSPTVSFLQRRYR